jgi:hypothetical protein
MAEAMNDNTEDFHVHEQSYAARTPPTTRRTWEDFQRDGFCTSVTFASFANPEVSCCATIFNGDGNVIGQSSNEAGAKAKAVVRGNIVWPINKGASL